MEDFAAAEKFKSQSHQASELRQDPDVLVSEPSLHSEPFPAAFSSAMSFESEELNDFGSESPSIHEPELHHSNSTEQRISSGPYIRVVHHSHSGHPDDFIYHDANTPTPSNDGNIVTQLYDDIDSGESWWNIQNALQHNPDLPHCFLPLHIWLDKGKVSTTVKLHPALLRAGFLPGDIRNGSGNGGAVLFLMMPVVEDPHDPKSQTEAQKTAFAFLKRSIYYQVLRIALQPLQHPSLYGEAVTCSNSVQQVLTTGITIQSVDGEEAAWTCATWGALALHPCPQCLVHKDELTKLTKNAFWTIANSDPYSAVSYDTLHSDDLGKWGKHLFPKMVEVLGNMKQGGKYSEFMSQIPSWPGLKNVQNVITLDFSDGNTFWDILKTTVPCIVQLFPPKSSIVHCVRALATFQMFAGLHMITSLQLDRIQVALGEYETYCEVHVFSQLIK
ncbi:hypothetical protein BU17DRAFT_72535 [Hysterangium stoloniferum]|nr:hypothetical protein BU17DRAFT_72535 [Hysterangium stoloniferum]